MRWLIGILGVLLLSLYLVGTPRRVAKGGLALDSSGDSFLQVEEGEWSEGFLDPHETLTLYLYQSNGWFREPTRFKLWVGDSEGKLNIDDVKFLPRDPLFPRCVYIEVPRYVNSSVPPGVPSGVSQNGNTVTFCL